MAALFVCWAHRCSYRLKSLTRPDEWEAIAKAKGVSREGESEGRP